jgi:hypothetical protein
MSIILRPFIGLLYQHWMIDGDDCEAIGGMNEWQGKQKYSVNPVLVRLWRQQIPRVTWPDLELGSPRCKAGD